MTSDRALALAAGGDDFDTKPVRFERLLEKIETLLERRRRPMTAAARIGSLLVVDDNEDNRDALSRRLALKGYRVRVAAGGAEALAMVAAEPFDLVLLDVEMPAHQRVRGPHPPARHPLPDASCRSSWSPPEPMAPTSSKRSGSAPTTTSPSRSISRWRSRASPRTCRTSGRSTDAARERRALRALRARRERRALGLESGHRTRSTGRRAGRRCSATPRPSSSTSPEEWLTRVHHDDAARVESGPCRRTWPAAAVTTRASTACCTGTARSGGCLPRRGGAQRRRDGDAAGRLAHRHHRREGVRRAHRAAEPADVRRPDRARARARAPPARLRLRARRPRPRAVQGRRQQPRSDDGRPPAGRGRAAAAVGRCASPTPSGTATPCARSRACRATSSRCCSTTSPMPTDAVRIAGPSAQRAGKAVRGRRAPGVHVGGGRHRGQHRRNTSDRRRCCATPRPRSTARRSTGPRGASCSIRRCATARLRGCRSRPTCGARSRTAGSRPVPADRGARDGRHRRVRGAGALAASDARDCRRRISSSASPRRRG